MQNSEDDMNELFRKASKSFRLNLPGEDWDAIRKRLAVNASASVAVENKIRSRDRYKLLIIALIIYALSGTTAYTVFNIHRRPQGLQKEMNLVRASRSIISISSRSRIINPAIPDIIPVTGNSPDLHEPDVNYSDRINATQAPATIQMSAASLTPAITPIPDVTQIPVAAQAPAKIPGTAGKNNKKGPGMTKNNRFYIGMIAGPQFNNTKEQEFSQPGISAGLLAGYRLNGKLAIETGFLISDKKYRSAGGYFDMSKVSASMPAGMKVLSVESKSTVLEIPLRIKYDWLKMKRGQVFGTAGLSSYILTKESNRYLGSLNGSQEDLRGSYSQSQEYFAAAVSVSAGYQFTTGRGTTLRIEPYVQVPVKKIGVGSLPVLSTGVYLGVTIPLSR